MYDFELRDISHEFVIAFMKESRSSGNIKAMKIDSEIIETLPVFIMQSFSSTHWRGSLMEFWWGGRTIVGSHCENCCWE